MSELVSCSRELPIPVLPETAPPFVEPELGSATDICLFMTEALAGGPLLLVSVDTGPEKYFLIKNERIKKIKKKKIAQLKNLSLLSLDVRISLC
jgi:hypothetical protein